MKNFLFSSLIFLGFTLTIIIAIFVSDKIKNSDFSRACYFQKNFTKTIGN